VNKFLIMLAALFLIAPSGCSSCRNVREDGLNTKFLNNDAGEENRDEPLMNLPGSPKDRNQALNQLNGGDPSLYQ
jgi:hypothetical protein